MSPRRASSREPRYSREHQTTEAEEWAEETMPEGWEEADEGEKEEMPDEDEGEDWWESEAQSE